jgi:hypothetical protein
LGEVVDYPPQTGRIEILFMNWRIIILLGVLGLSITVLVAAFEPSPGYMDADYYYAVGLQLAGGKGFTEPFIWNYLENPQGLPHPSNAYWMPLASILSGAGIILYKSTAWISARIGFIAIASSLPPLTAMLAWSFTKRRDFAIVSGLLAVFSSFYLPFLPVTDTFGIYMFLGVVYFLIMSYFSGFWRFILLGLICGLFHLARADGLIWLLITILSVFFINNSSWDKSTKSLHSQSNLKNILFILIGYLLIMAPWFIRNQSAFGSPLAPGTSKALWLTYYDQLFSYPSNSLNPSVWWESGLAAIIKARLSSLGMNLSTVLSVQAEIFLLPFILIGYWQMRNNTRMQLAGAAWLLTLIIMTFIFPFAGARGGFLHSGAALQPVLWVIAPIGLDRSISWAAKLRGWNHLRAGKIFQYTAVAVAAIISGVVIGIKVVGIGNTNPWGQENLLYQKVEDFLKDQGDFSDEVVMVANPPGYFLESGNPSIAVPDGNPATLLAVAQKYHAKFVILEQGSTPAGLVSLYENPHQFPALIYLGNVDDTQIFRIQ